MLILRDGFGMIASFMYKLDRISHFVLFIMHGLFFILNNYKINKYKKLSVYSVLLLQTFMGNIFVSILILKKQPSFIFILFKLCYSFFG
jgi:hypothetical protein